MKLIFMGKNAAQWLMKSLVQIVVGVNPKYFYKFREGDVAYTLQQCSNSFGLFLLLSKFKVGGSRRSIIFPEGRVKNGWRVFGLELRKMLEPGNYVNRGSSHSKFVAQLQKDNSGVHPFKSFADAVFGHQVSVNIPGLTTLGGRDVGSRRTNVEFELGETNPVGNRRSFPLKFKSKLNEAVYGKERELRNPYWKGEGLTVEVNGEGRSVAWNPKKGGLRSSKWVTRNQREHVVGPSHGSRGQKYLALGADQFRRVAWRSNKSGLRNSTWVTTSQREKVADPSNGSRVHIYTVVGSDLNCNNQMDLPVFSNPKPTGPSRKEMSDGSFLVTQAHQTTKHKYWRCLTKLRLLRLDC